MASSLEVSHLVTEVSPIEQLIGKLVQLRLYQPAVPLASVFGVCSWSVCLCLFFSHLGEQSLGMLMRPSTALPLLHTEQALLACS